VPVVIVVSYFSVGVEINTRACQRLLEVSYLAVNILIVIIILSDLKHDVPDSCSPLIVLAFETWSRDHAVSSDRRASVACKIAQMIKQFFKETMN